MATTTDSPDARGPGDLDPLGSTSVDNTERMCRIIAARAAVDASNAELRAAVHAAREAGDSCAMIAAALDTARGTSSLDEYPPTTS